MTFPEMAPIIHPSPDSRWLRRYDDGDTWVLVEHTYDGRLEISGGHRDRHGYRASFSRHTAELIADFIRSLP